MHWTFQVPTGAGAASESSQELQRSLDRYLATAGDSFSRTAICEVGRYCVVSGLFLPGSLVGVPLHQHDFLQDVLGQICSTLFDYPSIRNSGPLLGFIQRCVGVAWSLSTQPGLPYSLEYEERQWTAEAHSRPPASDPASNTVRTYVWPALKHNNQVVSKAVVIT